MSYEMLQLLAVLAVVVVLFVTERLRVDVVALLGLLAVAWLGLVTPQQALSGFSSNAVISIIAVMVMGHGMDRTGVMNRVARPIIGMAGRSEGRLITLVSGTAGLLSAFMQNIGAAALFLPAVQRISQRLRVPPSRLFMPLGFSAILGGTLTMVGSSPLIVLNDLLRQGDAEPFDLFAVTPVGLVLLGAGVLYFLVLGRFLLPGRGQDDLPADPQAEIAAACGLPTRVHRAIVPEGSPLVGQTLEEAGLWRQYGLHVLLAKDADGGEHPTPWRHTPIQAGLELVYLAPDEQAACFFCDHGLLGCDDGDHLEDRVGRGERAGFAEVVVRPRAPLAGRSIRQLELRRQFAVEPMALSTGGRTLLGDFSDTPLQPGDVLVVHGRWDRVKALGDDPSFLLVTPVKAPPREQRRAGLLAAASFGGAILLALAGFPLSISLLTGAVAMVVLGVVPTQEAWRAVDWRTVFLLAGLIPLGVAMDETGTAATIAGSLMSVLGGAHPLLLLLAVAALTTAFTLVMSNVAATVILVPLVTVMAAEAGLEPRGLALLVAVAASNSFLLPTHQVNALLMGPGGYRNADYLRAGGPLTLLVGLLASVVIWLFYL